MEKIEKLPTHIESSNGIYNCSICYDHHPEEHNYRELSKINEIIDLLNTLTPNKSKI